MSIYIYDYLCQVKSYLKNCESYEYIQQSFHDLRILHLFEQYMTDFQFNLHFFLQLNGLLHTGHTLVSVFSLPNTRDILLYHNLWGSVHSIPHKVLFFLHSHTLRCLYRPCYNTVYLGQTLPEYMRSNSPVVWNRVFLS